MIDMRECWSYASVAEPQPDGAPLATAAAELDVCAAAMPAPTRTIAVVRRMLD